MNIDLFGTLGIVVSHRPVAEYGDRWGTFPPIKSYFEVPSLSDHMFIRFLVKSVAVKTAICSKDRLKEAVEGFKPFKFSGKDGIYPILLQKGWDTVKKHYGTLFRGTLWCGYVPMEYRLVSRAHLYERLLLLRST
jgi:hypothetical protein